MRSGMGNEVSAGEGDPQESGEEGDWTSRKDSEASGGLWLLSHLLEDGEEVCVFTCSATSASQMQLCRSGAEHLRLLRHPNILKFLAYDVTMNPITLVTEPVLPLKSVMNGMCAEGMVTGWRGVAQGLLFLHDKAKLSHNSLCCECVYMCVNTSQWKIGGFEAAAQHSKISNTFIETIAEIRPPCTVPPEDKSPSPESSPAVPCHSRDVWAFSHLMLSAAEEANLSSRISDSMYTYIQQHMQNPDPTVRPTVAEILTQHWMRNDASEIAEFLSHLTVKSQSQKDEFFASLSPRLHSLPPRVVAENLVPLLLTPLVMTERVARRTLWPHLLTPVSSSHQKRISFDPSHICPLLDEDLFVYHVVPLLLNLMENHDYHVRMMLLEHLMQFAPLCPEDELLFSLLPEVLLGLNDVHDEMVQATLRALADLVELMGGETVMGTARSNIFADAAPRSQSMAVDKTSSVPSHATPTPLPTHLHPSPSSPSQEEVRRQRAERMREKREMQRQKKIAASVKLGVASSAVGVEINEEVESEELATHTNHAQYSPSVSHDEEDRGNRENVGKRGEEEEEEEEAWEEFVEEETGEDLGWGEGGEGWSEGDGDGVGEGWGEGGVGWGEGDGVGGWGEGDGVGGVGWGEGGVGEGNPSTDEMEGRLHGSEGASKKQVNDELESGWSLAGSQPGGEGGREKPLRTPPSRTGGALKLDGSGGKARSKEGGHDRGVSGSEKTEGAKGARLSEGDRLRLEEQAAWSREPDFFADMTPVFAKSSASKKVSVANKSSLQYQPTKMEGGGWNDF